MKIAVCSDLHLEFGALTNTVFEEADVLVLSGDVVIASLFEHATDEATLKMADTMRNFLKVCVDKYPLVIMLAGNHEHYHGDFAKTTSILKSVCASISDKLVFMENDTLVHNGVTFIGATLWTDLGKRNPVNMIKAGRSMNDYRTIKNGDNRLHPEDTVDAHEASLAYIKAQVASAETDKVVVCTHHAPTKLSVHPRYTDEEINSAYSSDLSEFILESPKIKLWTHGHTHHALDYTVGETRIVCNPRGYINHESIADDFKLKVVTI